MSTTTTASAAMSRGFETRLLKEAYGPGAWHGPDLKAATSDVNAELAYWRPAPERHNIAEIVVHHTYHVGAARAKIQGTPPEPFMLEGEDWFVVDNETTVAWAKIQSRLDAAHQSLAALIADVESGRVQSPLSAEERRDLVLGITCHAIYHAGQIQLLKRLRA